MVAPTNVTSALKNAAACVVLLPRFVLAALMLWLLDFQCVRNRFLHRSQGPNDEDDPPLCVSDSNRMFSLASLQAVWHGYKLDLLKSARVGLGAPNVEVVQLDGSEPRRILDFVQDARPLVLNFGSCT